MAAQQVHMQVWRGDGSGGEFRDYRVEAGEGMVVLDVIHAIQAQQNAAPVVPRSTASRGSCA
jgi:succinate dehydrogenase / fumarate reductase iron-sulfur subunit